jgi:peptide/nickel transport system ATP-binding protein
MEPLLRIEGLRVAYGEREVLRGAELTVAEGEAVGIAGVSGGGKTTLLQAVLGLLPAGARVAGEVWFRGRRLTGLGGKEMRAVRGAGIGLIPQEPAVALDPLTRVVEQVAEVLRAHGRGGVAEAREMLGAFFAMDAGRVGGSYPHELSGGERQRVVIAQAVSCGPGLAMADEPTSSLDTVTQHAVLTALRELRRERGMGLLMASHNGAALRYVCDRVVRLRDGVVEA